MCALVCEVPADCLANPNDACGDGGFISPCDAACMPVCDPCQVPTAYNPCPPGGDCNCPCPCGEYSSCCYQQPPRAQPIRPISSIMRSTAPLDTDTIYKRSYYANCGDCYRADPVRPCNNLQRSSGPMDTCTVQKLSYLPPCPAGRTMPIKPVENKLRFTGPVYAMTSQKHDYVPKGCSKRDPIRPMHGICRLSGPTENCTINKLSYMPNDVCQHPPPKPILQPANYVKPSGPIENCTVQKLSYMPVCLPKKECMPWAEKVRCIPPRYENLCTTYNLSYMPNCNPCPTQPISPVGGLKLFGTDINDGNTVYKLSYMPVDSACCRPNPIRPISGLCLPTGPMEKCTVHKLSYQPNCCATRAQPVRPKENCIKPSGPMYNMTTNKHDYVPKPICRRAPILQPSHICRATANIDSCTINKLSYMPICDYQRPEPIKPPAAVFRAEGPIETCTTYKLSYLPNCIGPKEAIPWARVSSYCKPTAPIEKCTIQKLSYGPPGTFSKCGGCCQGNQEASAYPSAGIC